MPDDGIGPEEAKQLRREHRKKIADAAKSPLNRVSPIPTSNIEGGESERWYLPVEREFPEKTEQSQIIEEPVFIKPRRPRKKKENK